MVRPTVRKAIGFVVMIVLVACVCTVLWNRRTVPSVKTGEEFVKSFSFARHHDGQPIGDVIELEKGVGIYADVSYTPREAVPPELGGQPVQDSLIWPFAVRIYPCSDGDARNAVVLRVQRYPSGKITKASIRNNSVMAVPQGTTGMWRENEGFHGPPAVPKFVGKERRLWTFLSPQTVEQEDHVFELVVYPTARWLSKNRSQSGDPVILKRGVIRLKS